MCSSSSWMASPRVSVEMPTLGAARRARHAVSPGARPPRGAHGPGRQAGAMEGANGARPRARGAEGRAPALAPTVIPLNAKLNPLMPPRYARCVACAHRGMRATGGTAGGGRRRRESGASAQALRARRAAARAFSLRGRRRRRGVPQQDPGRVAVMRKHRAPRGCHNRQPERDTCRGRHARSVRSPPAAVLGCEGRPLRGAERTGTRDCHLPARRCAYSPSDRTLTSPVRAARSAGSISTRASCTKRTERSWCDARHASRTRPPLSPFTHRAGADAPRPLRLGGGGRARGGRCACSGGDRRVHNSLAAT